MELTLTRKIKSKFSTIGELDIDGKFECYILEDIDRGLSSDMPLEGIKKKKVFAQTAIPTGRYQVVMTYSNRFKLYLPLLVNVPGFTGVRIHAGNTAADTEGCLLAGTSMQKDFVANSRIAMRTLMAKLKKAEQTEKIFITIK